ncbi:MAG: hypothetical protein IPH20_06825 [Bacteroidales bacterium]|nr:hypothetical protein [Bacteroidales bacterium]
MPSFGYNNRMEIGDKNKRVKLKLPVRKRMPVLDENNLAALNTTSRADWVEINTVISTSPDQIAVAPGSLIKSWEAGGQKYFNYRLDKKSLNFYSFISLVIRLPVKNGMTLILRYIIFRSMHTMYRIC